MAKRKSREARADVSCAVCGKPLTLWDRTTALDGSTVCAADCLGPCIVTCRTKPEFQDEEAPSDSDNAERNGSWHDTDIPE
jgi:hypothetical protein